MMHAIDELFISLSSFIIFCHHLSHLGHVVHEHLLNAVLEGVSTGRTAAARAFHDNPYDACVLVEAQELNVSSVVLHHRPDSGVQNLFDGLDTLRVFFLSLGVFCLGGVCEEGVFAVVEVSDDTKHEGLYVLPLGIFSLADGNELGAVENSLHSVSGHQFAGHGRTVGGSQGHEVMGTCWHHTLTGGHEFKEVGIGGRLGLNENTS